MTINAHIINKKYNQVSDDYIINGDDDFDIIVSDARSYDEAVAIKWYRPTDGQTAYWGPNGALLEPHWFNGNTNAQKGVDPATSFIHARCTPSDKAKWVTVAQAQNLKLTEWIVKTLNNAV